MATGDKKTNRPATSNLLGDLDALPPLTGLSPLDDLPPLENLSPLDALMPLDALGPPASKPASPPSRPAAQPAARPAGPAARPAGPAPANAAQLAPKIAPSAAAKPAPKPASPKSPSPQKPVAAAPAPATSDGLVPLGLDSLDSLAPLGANDPFALPTLPGAADPLAMPSPQPKKKGPAAKVAPLVGGAPLGPLDAGALAASALDAPGELPQAPADDMERFDKLGENFVLWVMLPSVVISALVHATIVIVMSFWAMPEKTKQPEQMVLASTETEGADEIVEFDDPLSEVETESLVSDLTAEATDAAMASMAIEPVMETGVLAQGGLGEALSLSESIMGTSFEGRSEEQRAAMVKKSGGTVGSERAVGRALEWFAHHQREDGSWNFDHSDGGDCNKRCPNKGKLTNCPTGATAMALLPFLGAGNTHKHGPHRERVEKGLDFLVKQIRVTDNRGDLSSGDGNMYSHGLAAIALCEAYGMTKDSKLREPAQLAINHTLYAQHDQGGWRYGPKQPGDTSAVGWQLMALKSGRMSALEVPTEPFLRTVRFLDFVQAKQGARYGYDKTGEGDATTAVGLLCRMYTGWSKDHPALLDGAKWISDKGPSKGNMYYNYYATQVMRHLDDPQLWPKWNKAMRGMLVDTQVSKPQLHINGSWYMKGGDHGSDVGGRLYCTSLATMILEVYYRHMPIYGDDAVDAELDNPK